MTQRGLVRSRRSSGGFKGSFLLEASGDEPEGFGVTRVSPGSPAVLQRSQMGILRTAPHSDASSLCFVPAGSPPKPSVSIKINTVLISLHFFPNFPSEMDGSCQTLVQSPTETSLPEATGRHHDNRQRCQHWDNILSLKFSPSP